MAPFQVESAAPEGISPAIKVIPGVEALDVFAVAFHNLDSVYQVAHWNSSLMDAVSLLRNEAELHACDETRGAKPSHSQLEKVALCVAPAADLSVIGMKDYNPLHAVDEVSAVELALPVDVEGNTAPDCDHGVTWKNRREPTSRE